MGSSGYVLEQLMTAFWFLFAFSAGTILGFLLCAALTISAEQQRRASRLALPVGLHPLESDSRM